MNKKSNIFTLEEQELIEDCLRNHMTDILDRLSFGSPEERKWLDDYCEWVEGIIRKVCKS